MRQHARSHTPHCTLISRLAGASITPSATEVQLVAVAHTAALVVVHTAAVLVARTAAVVVVHTVAVLVARMKAGLGAGSKVVGLAEAWLADVGLAEAQLAVVLGELVAVGLHLAAWWLISRK